MFSIHLADDLHARLNDLAERTDQPISHHVREAIMAYLDDQEDLCLAEQRLSEIRSGRSTVHALEDVMRMVEGDGIKHRSEQ